MANAALGVEGLVVIPVVVVEPQLPFAVRVEHVVEREEGMQLWPRYESSTQGFAFDSIESIDRVHRKEGHVGVILHENLHGELHHVATSASIHRELLGPDNVRNMAAKVAHDAAVRKLCQDTAHADRSGGLNVSGALLLLHSTLQYMPAEYATTSAPLCYTTCVLRMPKAPVQFPAHKWLRLRRRRFTGSASSSVRCTPPPPPTHPVNGCTCRARVFSAPDACSHKSWGVPHVHSSRAPLRALSLALYRTVNTGPIPATTYRTGRTYCTYCTC